MPGEVPVITGPDEGAAAGHGRLRASHADREHVIDTLKTAFADGRLDRGELDDRVGQTLAARTYAELAAATAGIPARPTQAPPPRKAARPPARKAARPPARKAARPPVNKEAVTWGLIGAGAMIPPALFVTALFGVGTVALLAFPLLVIEMIVAIIVVPVMLASQRKERVRASRGQLPPQPGQPGRVTESGRHASSNGEPSPRRTGTEQACADVPARKPRRRRDVSERAGRILTGAGAPGRMRYRVTFQ
jgi:hypothetical protein